MIIKQFKKYRCIIKQRTEYAGSPLKEHHAEIEGQPQIGKIGISKGTFNF